MHKIKETRGAMAIELRKLRIDTTEKLLKGMVPCRISEAIATISYNLNVSQATARDYIKLLVAMKGFCLAEGNLILGTNVLRTDIEKQIEVYDGAGKL